MTGHGRMLLRGTSDMCPERRFLRVKQVAAYMAALSALASSSVQNSEDISFVKVVYESFSFPAR